MMRRTFLAGLGATAIPRSVQGAVRRPLRIAQIGTAHAHASGKMLAMRALPALWEIAGIVDPELARLKDTTKAKTFEGVPLLTEAQLLGRPDVSVVAIETRVEDLCPTALRALQAGKHVHLDKPGSLDHTQFKAMRAEAQRRGLVVQMGYMLRYNPAFEMLCNAVREGWLGEIAEIDAVMGKLGAAHDRVEIKALPGGGMFELGCHVIDVIVALLGRPLSVRATSTPTQSDGTKDNQLAVLEYPRATAVVRVNFADPFGMPRRRFSVTGTEGTFEIQPMESGNVKLSLTAARGKYQKGIQSFQLPREGGRYDAEFVDLARVVGGEKPLAWSTEHDIDVHETVLRAAGVWTGA